MALCFVLRLVLLFQYAPKEAISLGNVISVILDGLYRDLFVAMLVNLPLFTWFWVIPNDWFEARWHRLLFLTAAAAGWSGLTFLMATEYFFFDEFRSRFNTVAVDYLLYPHEVFINIRDSYPVGWVVAACLAVGAGWVALTVKLFNRHWTSPYPPRIRLARLAGLFVICLAMATTIPLKGANATTERTMNEIANNGWISFAAAIWTRDLDYRVFYRTLPLPEAYQRVRRLLAEPGVKLDASTNSVRRTIPGDSSRPKLNVVILLEESLGSEFWGSLGRKEPSLTPEMDRLANEDGMLFTNIYACGNRTVRGLEGVLSSFPPLPGDSLVVRDRSDNVETIARVLKRDGYSTEFLYGGRGLFDNMRSFATRNGFDRFIELKDFASPTFTTIWGVCDEDLFQRAIVECRELSQSGKPFLVTCLSVSNHKPFTYPKGRIAEDPDKRWRNNAVKYSDYALGQFFRAARKESFWTNTIFAVVADHGARVYGSQTIPIHSYEIPFLVAGPAVIKSPSRPGQLGNSLDVAPTILGLINRPYESCFFGRDLLNNPPANGRAVMHHNRDVGMFKDDRLVVLGLRKEVEYYEGNPKAVDMRRVETPTPEELELEKDATALFQVANDLYLNQRYRIDL